MEKLTMEQAVAREAKRIADNMNDIIERDRKLLLQSFGNDKKELKFSGLLKLLK
jgi:hypothetical protein